MLVHNATGGKCPLGVADSDEYLYRGVPSNTERGRLAKLGIVKPRGRLSGQDAYYRHVHNDPNVKADVTSWSRLKSVAKRFGDTILRVRLKDVQNRIKTHPDPAFKPDEAEVLIQGTLNNVPRIQ